MDRTFRVDPIYPLWGAEQRAERASVHIDELQEHLQQWTESNVHIADSEDPVAEMLREESRLLLARSSVWIGETIYNLRSALDYVIYDFACIANGFQHVPDTQFPICDSWGEFETMRKRRLRHVPEPVIERLRQLQPCSEPPCRWTHNLRELSNADKHRALAGLRFTAAVLRGDHEDLAAFLSPEDRTADDHHFVIGIFFKETEIDVIETLKVLQREVRALVEEFKLAFKRSGDVIEIEYEPPAHG